METDYSVVSSRSESHSGGLAVSSTERHWPARERMNHVLFLQPSNPAYAFLWLNSVGSQLARCFGKCSFCDRGLSRNQLRNVAESSLLTNDPLSIEIKMLILATCSLEGGSTFYRLPSYLHSSHGNMLHYTGKMTCF